jgi:signal transduction histidine kinase
VASVIESTPTGESHDDAPGAGKPWLLRLHASVFGKLVVIMLSMAATLLVLVTGFFWFITGSTSGTSIDVVLREESRAIAARSPDREEAARLGARFALQVRYKGPRGDWSTASDLPEVDDVREHRGRHWTRIFRGRHYYLVNALDGGAYLFVWDLPRAMLQVHAALLVALLFVISTVVLTAHVVLKRLLYPLRELSGGVARFGSGELDVVLPTRTEDEFGHLTHAFNQMVTRVRGMIAARDQLLLDVSHELRSPLTRMKVALELPEPEQRAALAADVAEMERMITELLELERLRDGRAIRPVRQDLVPILHEVTEGFRKRSPGVQVVSTLEPMLVDVDGDKVRTVLRNLLDNAIKYSLPDSRAVEVSATNGSDHVVIRVTDDGPGIPERDVPNLFEPFFRVDRSRSKKTGGYGLGLSISKRIVEAHGGTIGVERNTDRGSSFVVMLPKPV